MREPRVLFGSGSRNLNLTCGAGSGLWIRIWPVDQRGYAQSSSLIRAMEDPDESDSKVCLGQVQGLVI